MNKEQQDLAWACLPKEARKEIRAEYQNAIEGSDLEDFLIDFFSHHNLTSDTEPEEMLMVKRKGIQTVYRDKMREKGHHSTIQSRKDMATGWLNAMRFFFSKDKCLPDKVKEELDYRSIRKIDFAEDLYNMFKDEFPDKEQPSVQGEPRKYFESDYCIGDKVVICISSIGEPRKEVVTLLRQYQPQCEYSDYAKTWVVQTQDGMTYQSNEEHFEPYTEPEKVNNEEKSENNSKIPNLSQNPAENCDNGNLNSKTDNMEEKELNLCELLKGCEGEEFFSISVGKVMFKAIYDYDDTHKVRTIRKDAVGNEYNVNFHSDGRRNKSGLPDLYPSEDLLKKYPLDANKAWDEWASERKSKYKLRVKVSLYENEEWREDKSSEMWMSLNSPSDALQATEVVRDALEKFYEKNCKQ